MTELKKSWDCYTCYIIRSSSLRSLIRPIYCVAAERVNQGPGRQQRRDIQHQDKLWPILIMTIIWLTAGIMSRVRQLGQTIRGFNEKGVWANTDIQNDLIVATDNVLWACHPLHSQTGDWPAPTALTRVWCPHVLCKSSCPLIIIMLELFIGLNY